MGLNIVVGVIPALYAVDDEDDEEEIEEALDDLREEFTVVNRSLRFLGLPEHQEPVQVANGGEWECEVGQYVCLHYLRRIAAYLALGREIPGPVVEDDPTDDPVFAEYNAQCHLVGPAFTSRGGVPMSFSEAALPSHPVLIQGPGFEHLLWHSDCTGYYLPISFPQVIVLPEDPRLEWHRFGPWLGSSQTLLRGCERLAEALQYPRSLTIEELRKFTPDPAATDWRRYAVEAFMCQALVEACEASVRSGCAVAFC